MEGPLVPLMPIEGALKVGPLTLGALMLPPETRFSIGFEADAGGGAGGRGALPGLEATGMAGGAEGEPLPSKLGV